jgi:hypothetical protein
LAVAVGISDFKGIGGCASPEDIGNHINGVVDNGLVIIVAITIVIIVFV